MVEGLPEGVVLRPLGPRYRLVWRGRGIGELRPRHHVWCWCATGPNLAGGWEPTLAGAAAALLAAEQTPYAWGACRTPRWLAGSTAPDASSVKLEAAMAGRDPA
jgi:hypothetical protein